MPSAAPPPFFPRGLIFLVGGCSRSRLFTRQQRHLRQDSCTIAIRREFEPGPFFASSSRWGSACSRPSAVRRTPLPCRTIVRYQNPSAATIRRFAHSHDPTEPHPAARLLHRCCRAPRSAGPAAQQSIRNILIFKGALPGAAAFQARLSCQAGPVGRTPST